jgi:uncharacterized membrane protein YesL
MTQLTRAMEAALAVLFAGLLWAVASVPIVTLGPATAALQAVMNAWGEDGPPAVWSTFWSGFGRHFRQALLTGLLATLAAALLTIDLLYGLRAGDAPLRAVVLVVAILGSLSLAGTLVFLYPVMVRYPAPWRRVVRNGALFAAAYPFSTLAALASMAAGAVAVAVAPLLLPVVAGLCGWFVSRLTARAFARYHARQDAAGPSTEPASLS